jgi:STIP1 family protein 1
MSPAADGAAASKRQAELLKQEGNTFFKKDRISAAIDAYTGVSRATRGRPLFS